MDTRYRIEIARPRDADAWMALVALVADNFPGLELPAYRQTLDRNIERGSALCAKRGEDIVGVLLYSVRAGTLSCMAVHPAHRRRGIGAALVREMIGRFPPDADISVSTFREGDPLGDAPRALYRRFGFEPGELIVEFGYPNQRFVRRAGHRPVTVRRTLPGEHRTTEEVAREAFWGRGRARCDEHLLAHDLRAGDAYVPELDMCAEVGGRIVGMVVYARAHIVDVGGASHEVLTFGPLAVLPGVQHGGIGSALMRATIAEARRLGYRAIVMYGEPDYYPRLGFSRAADFGLRTASGGDGFDAFLALPLYEGALDGLSGGRFIEPDAYDVDAEAADAYDRTFPPKPDAVPTDIGALLDRLGDAAREAFARHGIRHVEDLRRYSGREVAAWPVDARDDRAAIDEALRAIGWPGKAWPV